ARGASGFAPSRCARSRASRSHGRAAPLGGAARPSRNTEREDSMSSRTNTPATGSTAMLQWLGGLGAATAEALADRDGTTVRSARARLAAAARAGLLSHARPLAGQPALYALTTAGLRASRIARLQPCRVSASNAMHLIVCAGV